MTYNQCVGSHVSRINAWIFCYVEVLQQSLMQYYTYAIVPEHSTIATIKMPHTEKHESLDLGCSYLHIGYISREYRSGLYMKVIASRLQEQKHQKCVFPRCKTSIFHNSASIKDRATRFACCMEFTYTLYSTWPEVTTRKINARIRG